MAWKPWERAAITAAVVVALGVESRVTFGSFTAEARNASSYASGTLVLSDAKSGGTTCLSTGGGTTDTNVNTGCDSVVGLTGLKPGDSASANLTLKNVGSLPASAFTVRSAACTDGDAAGESYHGTGSMCGNVVLGIQQYSDAAFSVPSACLYGGGTATTCAMTDTTKTLSAFRTAYPSAASPKAIGSGLAAGTSAYVKVTVQLPSTADNTVQGRTASFDLTWHLDQ